MHNKFYQIIKFEQILSEVAYFCFERPRIPLLILAFFTIFLITFQSTGA